MEIISRKKGAKKAFRKQAIFSQGRMEKKRLLKFQDVKQLHDNGCIGL